MKYEDIYKMLTTTGSVYILDDYQEIAVRLEQDKKRTIAFAKRKGRSEFPASTSDKFIFDAEQEGVEITKKEYDTY